MSNRKVFVSDGIATDSRLCRLANTGYDLPVLLWPHFLPHFDDWGRLELDPESLKWRVFPAVATVTADTIRDAFTHYASVDLVEIWESGGRTYAAVPPERWFRWQTMVRAEKRANDAGSKLPQPPSWKAWKNGGSK